VPFDVSIPDSGVVSQRSGAACGSSPRPDAGTCSERRRRVAAAIGSEAALVLGGGELHTRSNDTEFRFRPDSDFYYLTGLAEPGAVMVLRPGHDPELTLFVRARDPEKEVWSGRRVGPDGATETFGANKAFPLEELAKELPGLLDGARQVYLPLGSHERVRREVLRVIEGLRRRNRYGSQPPEALIDARVPIGEDRIAKDEGGLRSLRRAVDITVAGHLEAMRRVRPGMHEYEIEALIEYEFRRRGSAGPGYGTIVGAGDNATILHYVDNDGLLRAGSLLLVDAGAEFDLMSGDVTRTYPVSGRFTPAQRDLYDIVLAANRAGIEATTVGNHIDAIHHTCLKILVQGLLDLGLVEGSMDQLLEQEGYKKYYMHRTSHWLGADVHDAGYYCLQRQPRSLRPGFVLTVEPGLYVAADDTTAPAELRGTGIRIEDDVLVGEGGPEVLTHGAPKAIAELEAIIGSAAAAGPRAGAS
jgi:Xaa-Pro aminopeptidase